MLFGVVLRLFYWRSKSGLFIRDGIQDLDGYWITGWELLQGFWPPSNMRVTQLFYPVLLMPHHLFPIDLEAYILGLHLWLAVGAILFAYLIGKHFHSREYGALVAGFVAIYPSQFQWFNWLLTETTYYFTCLWFAFASVKVWERRNFFRWSFFLIALVSLLLTKPEAIAPIWASLIVLYFAILVKRKPARSVVFQVLGFHLVVLSLVVTTLSLSAPIRKAFFSHMHVAWGLWLGTRVGANVQGFEQARAISEAHELTKPPAWDAARTRTDEEQLLERKAAFEKMSLVGLETFKESPLRTLELYMERVTGFMFPGIFWTSWSSFRRIMDLGLTFFVFGGLCLAILLDTRLVIRGLGFVSLAAVLFSSAYLSDGDLRFRIPVILMTLPLTPMGWLHLKKYLPRFARQEQHLATQS